MKKLFLALSAFFLLVFLAWPPVVKADIYSFQQELKNCGQGNSFSLECWIAGADQLNSNGAPGVLTGLTQGLITMLIGELPSLEEINSTAPASYRPGGAVGVATNLIAKLYTHPPASSVEYFADLGRNLGIIKPAYAQTQFAFSALSPILGLWKGFRNIAYLLFALIFVLVGFAIMFRAKINPQTVISIQSAIPRLVVTLILITFSYAIAGLIIDLMYVAVNFFAAGLEGAGAITSNEAFDLSKKYMTSSLMDTVGKLFSVGLKGITNLIGTAGVIIAAGILLGAILGVLVPVLGLAEAGSAAAALASGAGGGILLLALGWIISVISYLIRIIFMLIKAYAMTVFLIVLGPLLIAIDAIPGQKMASSWFRSLLANILVFPITALIIFLGDVVILKIGNFPMWSAPLVGGGASLVKAVLGFGTLIIIPGIADMLQRTIGGWGVPVSTPTTVLVREKEALTQSGWKKITESIATVFK